MQRNCHRNIHNQFSRGLSLHCSWQQDWYHGCGKSETAGQDNAGNKVAEWLLKSHNFSFLDAVLLPDTMYTLYIMKPFFVKCVLLPRNLVSGVRACGWLWPSTVSMAPAESSLDGSLQAYLKNPTILSHVFTVTTWFFLEKHSPLEWKRLCWRRFVEVCHLNIKDVSVQNFLFPRYHLFLLVISAIKALEFSVLW